MSEFKALETLVHLSRAQFLCRAAESEARCGRRTLQMGFLAAIHRHPYCLVTRVREAALSGVGVQTPGWDFTGLPAVPASWPPPRREDEGGRSWLRAHLSAQSTSCLSSGRLCTQAPSFPRERHPRVTPTLASSVCDFHTKTNHIPRTCLPTPLTLTLLEYSFRTIFNLSGGFLFWSWI